MSYRTYINEKQVFGNNEYYPEWIEYIESKGIVVGQEGDYEGELDDFMEALDVIESIVIRLETERRENKKNGEEFFTQSLFDLSNIYDDVANYSTESLLDKELLYLENGYMFMPYAFLKACENIIEDKGYSFKGKHTRIFKLKDNCKIKIHAC